MNSSESMEVDEDTTISPSNIKIINFIRHFLLKKAIEKAETHNVFRTIFSNENNFEETLTEINQLLEKSNLMIKLTTCEVTAKEYYCLFSTFYQQESVLPNVQFNDSQLDFFQNVLKNIVVSENGTVCSTDCLNIAKKLSKSDAQDFLIKLIEEKILIKLSRGRLTLTPLAICELYPFMEYHFKNALMCCEICKKSVIFSALCPSCGIRIHKHCLEKYKNSMKKPKCTKCNASWVEFNCDDI